MPNLTRFWATWKIVTKSIVRALLHWPLQLLLRSTGNAAKLMWSMESKLREGCPDFCHVTGYGPIVTQTGNGFGSPKLQYMLTVFTQPSCVQSSYRWRSKLFNIIYFMHDTTCLKYFEQVWSPYTQLTPGRLVSFYNLVRYTRMCSCSFRDCFRPRFR